MPSYEIFGKFYDPVMGDRSGSAEHLLKLIRAAKPNARNVLELGCGTGSMLKHLQDNYQVSGLDISSRMLSIARKKVPRAKLFRQDMVDFQINDRFDVICCVFDSINHVQAFLRLEESVYQCAPAFVTGRLLHLRHQHAAEAGTPYFPTTVGTPVSKECLDHRRDGARESCF